MASWKKQARRARRAWRIEPLETRQVLATGGGEGLGTVTGRVWHDLDADGVQDTGEPAQNSVDVTLFSTDLRQSWRLETLPDGSFSFLAPPGDYRIGFDKPSQTGWVRSPANQGGDDTRDSDAGPGEYLDLTVPLAGSVVDLDVGHIQTGRIEGRVWHDVDHDGTQNDGPPESGVARATVQLLDAGFAVVREAQSNSIGAFSFVDLLPGTYYVGYVPPAGVFFGPSDLGQVDPLIDSDIDPRTGRSQPFLVTGGGNINSIGIGLSGLSSIGGTFWVDSDGDGLQEASEERLESSIVELWDHNLRRIAIVGTDFSGAYRFTDLLPGQYTINVPQNGLSHSPANVGADESLDSDVIPSLGRTEVISLAAGQDELNQNAGWYPPATVGWNVWHDVNRDGVYGDEQSSWFHVRLLDAGGNDVTPEPFTGQISAPGTYRLEAVLPAGVLLTGSDFDPVTRRTAPFTVNPGTNPPIYFSAGIYGEQSISGTVWDDLNGDGVRDAGEPGLPDFVLRIETFDDPTATTAIYAPWRWVRTDEQGNYRIDNALPGVYGIAFEDAIEGPVRFISPMGRGNDEARDSDFNPLLSRTSVFRVDGANPNVARDLGMYRPGAIEGQAWNDVNQDGVRQENEKPVSNLAIRLYDADGHVVGTKTTDSLGRYEFPQLALGAYTAEVIYSSGTSLSLPHVGDDDADSDFSPLTGRSDSIQVVSGQTQTVDAGLFGSGGSTSTGGIVWHDTDGDGVREPGEMPAEGVVVQLRSGTDVVATLSTAADGSYYFTNLEGDEYWVQVVPPTGATFSPMDRGENEAADSDINRSTGGTANFPLLEGQADVSRDAGLYSGPLSSDALSALRITEIGFIGGGGSAAEFLEIKNIGSQVVDLSDVALTRGVRFNFSTSRVRQLFPGEYVVVSGPSMVIHQVAPATALLAGSYSGDLNQEERLTLEDTSHGTIHDFTYDDAWFAITLDEATVPWTFEVVDEMADRRTWGNRSRWQPSIYPQGTPGYAATRQVADVPAPTYPPGTIVINEILTKSTDGFNDRIELHNTSNQTVDIGGWYLGDTENIRELDDLTRYQIAPGTTIPPGGYLVLTRDQHFGNPNDPGTYRPFGLSSYGEAVNLTGVDAAGRLVGYSESHEYSGTEPDLTFGRHVTSTGEVDFPALSHSTIGGDNMAPRVGPVVINEFMYKPSQYLEEYIELHNAGSADIDLGQDKWRIAVEGSVQCGQAPYSPGYGGLCFAPGNVIPAGGYALIVRTAPDEFRRKYGIPAEVGVFGPFLGTLDAGGDTIGLLRVTPEEREVVMDRVTYDDVFPWSTEADTGGIALERISPTAYGNDPASWAIPRGTGGTPGRVNTTAAAVDLDGDGRVGLRDLIILRNSLGSTGPALLASGDVNADSIVNRVDVALWLCSFGQTTAPPPAGQSPQAAVAIADSAEPPTAIRAGVSRRASRAAVEVAQEPAVPSVTAAATTKLTSSRQTRLSRQAVDRVFAE